MFTSLSSNEYLQLLIKVNKHSGFGKNVESAGTQQNMVS